ncbi:MAG: molybdopterin-dependent oxidoreductase [Nocardioides sp.]
MATDGGRPIGRRVFLGTLGLGAAAIAAAPTLQKTWSGTLGDLSQLDPTGVSGLLPNPGGFRYFSVAGHVDKADPATYRLTVGGLVDHPLELSLADLRAMRQTRITRDIVCTDGWSVEQVPVEGVRLADLLDAAGVQQGAAAVRFSCFDGVYTESLTLEQARRRDVLVALRMEEKPISHNSGGPVRLYVAPMYFYKSAKWLSGIEVVEKVEPGYWEQTGWPVDAWLPGQEPADA